MARLRHLDLVLATALKRPALLRISELVNLQSIRGQAKPYQVRQLMRLVERYDLRLEDRP